MRNTISIVRVLFVFSLFIFASCGGIQKTALIDVNVGEEAISRGSLGIYSDVTRAEIDIFVGATYHVQAQALTKSGANWSASFEVPLNVELTFEVRAYGLVNSIEKTIFSGLSISTISSSGRIVNITLDPVSDGEGLLFPSLRRIEMTTEIAPSEIYPANIILQGKIGETLSYVITEHVSGGTFSPDSGDHIVGANGYAIIPVTYTSPANSGGSAVSYTHSILLTNGQGNSCNSDFNTRVCFASENSLSIAFAPYVTALSASKSGNNLKLKAVIEDAAPLSVTYEWKMDGAVFSTGSASAILTGYSELTTGTIILTLVDEDSIKSVLTFELVKGLFPDNLVINSLPDPISFSFYLFWYSDKPEATDFLQLQVRPEGGTWYTVKQFSGADLAIAETKVVEVLMSTCPEIFQGKFQFRFYQEDFSYYDDCFTIDTLVVSQGSSIVFQDSFTSSSISSVNWPLRYSVSLGSGSTYAENGYALVFRSSDTSPRYIESKLLELQ